MAKDILKKCVSEKITYPVVIDKWMKDSSDSMGYLFSAYIRNAYINDANEQLYYIHKKDRSYLNSFAKDLKNPSEYLQKLILEGDPRNIWQLEDISEEVAMDHFEKHKNHILEMTSDGYFHESDKVQQKIYELISNHFIKNGLDDFLNEKLQDNPFVKLLKSYGEELLKVFDEKDPQFLRSIFQLEVSPQNHKYQVTFNFAQFLCFHYAEEHPGSDIDEQNYIIRKHLDLVLQPIKETVYNYDLLVDPLEFSLRNRHPVFIMGFTEVFEHLSEQNQNIYTTAVFESLKTYSPQVLDNAIHLAQTKLEPVNKELVEKYLKKNNIFMTPEHKDIINKILLHKKLNDNLEESPNKGSKIKI